MTDHHLDERAVGGFEDRLLPVLLAALEEREQPSAPNPSQPRHVRRRFAFLVGAVAILVITTALVVSGRSTIEVSAAHALANPDEVIVELREAGIEARILIVPVPRPMAGTWWHLFFAPGVQVDETTWAKLKAQVGVGVAQLPEEFRNSGRGVYHREVLELPRNLEGAITLVVGRGRLPGEPVAPMDNELAPDGAFWCLHLEEREPARAGQMLEQVGYGLLWIHNTFDGPGGESREVEEPPSGSALISAWFRSPELINLNLAPMTHVERLRRELGTPTVDMAAPPWAPGCEEG